ncbi:ABC transporter permease [Nocardioides carbamazepini]|uniref:ABC transporter permease n=1 Tax=Nocardioides carbamazepini TaxID=2854259 RepID=UPI00214A3728|nr:ABC transporter permease [Nocardioides carbamazepini]MCR1785715.1 ABC transporter permease [Nocardioides carbamazepini]
MRTDVIRRALGNALWPFISFGAILLAWELVAQLGGVPDYMLPSVSQVVERGWETRDLLITHGRWTILEIVGGFALSALIAIPLGMVIVTSRLLERLLYPPIVALNSVPKVGLAPLFVVWFGFGMAPTIAMTALVTFFPLLVNTVMGLRSVDAEMIHLARVMAATRLRLFLKVRLPHALPSIFAGLKVATSLAVIGALVSEFIASDRGWGYVLVSAGGQLDTALIFAVMILLSAVATAFFYLVAAVERLVVPWHSSQRQPH